MKEHNERIERLLARYFDAATTDAEERELRAYFRRATDLPASLRAVQAMLGGLEDLAAEELPAGREPAAASQTLRQPAAGGVSVAGPVAKAARRIPGAAPDAAAAHLPGAGPAAARRIRPLWGIAAAAVLAFGILLCASYLRKPYCYIDGVAVYDKEIAMQTVVYLESLSALDESSRMVDELIRNN